jgi:hypothetical protein
MRLGQPGMRDLIGVLGTEAGIAWLEAHIESPVGSEWGMALLHLNPSWLHLDRWIHKSKLHCLAAMDVLFQCTDPWGDGEERRLPDGADAKSINDAVDFALEHYGNPRLEKAAKEIRHAWPRGKRKRHSVNVPTPLAEAADLLLCHDSALVADWREKMATAKGAPHTAFKIWESLLSYAASKNCLAIVDWKEYPENIVASLRDLKPAEELVVEWDAFNGFEGDNEGLLHALATRVAGQGKALVCLDHGCDDYPLAILPAECVPRLVASIASLGDEAMRITPFGARTA